MRSSPRTAAVRTRVWTAGRFLILVVGLLLTFGAFFLAGLRVTSRAREVEVPSLTGKSVAEARALLAERGLELRVEEQRRADKTVPADHVLMQEPTAGEIVRRQRAVRVRLSDGYRAGLVPNLVDLPERTAEITLNSERIAIGYRAEVHSGDYRPGVVVAQDPAPQQRAAQVNLLINRSTGEQEFIVPDLIGTLGSRAVDVLRDLKFRAAVTSEVPYPGLPPGIVIRQTPAPGFKIQSDQPITLEVSR